MAGLLEPCQRSVARLSNLVLNWNWLPWQRGVALLLHWAPQTSRFRRLRRSIRDISLYCGEDSLSRWCAGPLLETATSCCMMSGYGYRLTIWLSVLQLSIEYRW